MAHTKGRKVWHQRGCMVERELAMKLQAICRLDRYRLASLRDDVIDAISHQ